MAGYLYELAVILVGDRIRMDIISVQIYRMRRTFVAGTFLIAPAHDESTGWNVHHAPLIGLGQEVLAGLIQLLPGLIKFLHAGVHCLRPLSHLFQASPHIFVLRPLSIYLFL